MGSVRIILLTILALTPNIYCAPLTDFFFHLTSNTSHSEHQLRLVVNITKDLVGQRLSVRKDVEAEQLARALSAICSRQTAVSLLQTSRECLAPLQRFAAVDSIVAVLGRRLLLACITLHRGVIQKNVLAGELESFFVDVARQLYVAHVETVLRKELLDYLHISKSGGTSFSQAARMSRCKMAPGIGQPVYLGDIPRWLNRTVFYELTGGIHIVWSLYGFVERGFPSSCAVRISNVTAKGFQYLSNEYTLHGGLSGMAAVHICPQAVNVVTLRSPDGRLVSHLHFLLAHIKVRLLRKSVPRDLFHRTFCTGNVSLWERLTPAIVDNYNVRSFVGERAFHTPLGGIGREHVEVARRLLLQFDLVLDLDAGEQAADLLMYQGLGWNVTLAEVHTRTAASVASRLHYNRSECSNEAMLEALLPRQGADRELYSLGRVLSLLDQLLLGWAKQLGLKPKPSGGVSSGDGVHCGLLDRSWRAPARLQLAPREVTGDGEGATAEAEESEEVGAGDGRDPGGD